MTSVNSMTYLIQYALAILMGTEENKERQVSESASLQNQDGNIAELAYLALIGYCNVIFLFDSV